MVSRQREYQKQHLAVGLCTHCHAPKLSRSKTCFRHHLFYMLSKRGLTKGVLTSVKSNKRERLAAHLSGRYQAVLKGFLKQSDGEQILKDAVDIRARLKITWGGIRGAQKLADIMKSIERHAAISRKENENVTST